MYIKMKLLNLKSWTSMLLIGSLLVACSKDEAPAPAEINLLNFEASIDENPTNGQVIGSLTATTSSGTLSFALSEQNPGGALAINAATGELSVANAALFDFSVRQTITATATARVGNSSRSANVIININEVAIVPAANILEHWRFDGNFGGSKNPQRAFIQGGNPDTQISATATDRFGAANKALRFNSDRAYLALPGQNFLVSGDGERSVSLWLKNLRTGTEADSEYLNYIFVYGNNTVGQAFGLNYNAVTQSNGRTPFFEVFTWGGIAGNRDMHVVKNLPAEWQHIMVTYKSGTLKLYVNGALQSSKDNVPAPNTPASSELSIGLLPNSSSFTSNKFELDDLIFYNRELTEAEIRTLARN